MSWDETEWLLMQIAEVHVKCRIKKLLHFSKSGIFIILNDFFRTMDQIERSPWIGLAVYAIAIRTPPGWNDVADQRLLALVTEKRSKWKSILQIFEDFTDIECQRRWIFLLIPARLR
jgi:hypothetical protein